MEGKVPLTYCHALSSRNASGHLQYPRSSIPMCVFPSALDCQTGTDKEQIPPSPPGVGARSPPCTLRSCLRVAVRGDAVRQRRPGVGREPAFGSQGVRIPEDLCLARWDGLCLLCSGAVPQRGRRAAGIVAAAAARSAARCSRVSQRLQNPEAGTWVPRLVQTSRSLGAAGSQS